MITTIVATVTLRNRVVSSTKFLRSATGLDWPDNVIPSPKAVVWLPLKFPTRCRWTLNHNAAGRFSAN